MTFEADQVEQLCRAYGSSILRRCRAILKNDAEAEDAAQEVMVLLFEKGQQFRGDAAVSTWIYRVTTNVCLNHIRSESRRRTREQSGDVRDWIEKENPDAQRFVVQSDVLREALGGLSDLDQQIFVLRHVDGLRQDEIAEVVGRSRRTINKRLKKLDEWTEKKRAEVPS